MSNGEKEWGGLVTGDTSAAMLSIARGGSRTDPPDKSESSAVEGRVMGARSCYGATCVAAVSPEQQQPQPFPPAGLDTNTTTPTTLEPVGRGRTSPQPPLTSTRSTTPPQQGKLPLCSRHSEPDPVQDSSEFKCAAAELQPFSHGHTRRHLGELRRYSYGKDPAARQYESAYSENVTSDPSVTQDGVHENNASNFNSASDTDASPGSKGDVNGSHAVNFRKDYAAIRYTTESTFSTPRLARCRRQSRVQSPEEPDNCYVIPKTESFSDNNFNSKQESCCKLYLDGKSLDISTEKVSIESEDHSSIFFPNNGHDSVSHRLSSDTKRSSADRESVISVTTSDDRQSETCEQPGGKKKRKKKSRLSRGGDDSRSNLSLSAANRGNNGEPGVNADDDNTNRPPSSCSSTKGSHQHSHHQNRRFAKRGLGGVFPSSNWRRLRNTLKAANEMQSTKKTKHTLTREDSFLRKFSTRNHQNVQGASQSNDEDVPRYHHAYKNFDTRLVLQHDGNFMFYWLGVVTVAVMYNIWTPIAREAFREIQDGCHICWFSFDALFDVIYVFDIIVQFRTGYLDQGLMVYDSKKLRKRYTRSKVIYVDFLSLFPLDLVQIFIGIHPMIRFPRFLKVYRTFRFVHMMESRTAYPNLIRVANLTHILFLGAHWFAAFYYMISEAEGFQGDWAYPKPEGEFAFVTRKYLRSLFWSTLTLTTIGDITPPEHNHEYVFLIVSYLIGVFVFATIVGQVGNVINNRNASRQEFERLLDGAKIYMQTHNVPHNLQKRVQRWYDYVWSRGRLNGCDINSLGLLPDKLKTELAIHVNLETLKKTSLEKVTSRSSIEESSPETDHTSTGWCKTGGREGGKEDGERGGGKEEGGRGGGKEEKGKDEGKRGGERKRNMERGIGKEKEGKRNREIEGGKEEKSETPYGLGAGS
ncbi:hypothetical protein Btru_002034 [Bulinus truncatus]|nr:hypothetical protein Btru_002034 [Bulinus truncatus]